MPKVSVIIPTHNRLQSLKAAISSVLNQTFQDYEIIIIDDASTYKTQEVVNAFEDKRIKYIRHTQKKGEAEARNTGILNSKSEYIAFLDDDDEWLPEKLTFQIKKIENSPQRIGLIKVGCFGYCYINGELVRNQMKYPSHRGNVYHALMKGNFIGPPSSVLIKRKCVEKIGLFDASIAYGLDYDYWIRISKQFDFDYISEPLVIYRIHNSNLSRNNELRAQGAHDLAKKYGNHIISNNYWRSIYLPLGVELCNKGEMIKGIKAILRAISYYPFNKCAYFYFVIALFGFRNFKRAIKVKEMLASKPKTTPKKGGLKGESPEIH